LTSTVTFNINIKPGQTRAIIRAMDFQSSTA